MVLSGFWLIFWLVAALLIGAILGLVLSRFTMKSYFKKNPPITEEMVSAMMSGMGQTPNKKKINQIMKKMKTQ